MIISELQPELFLDPGQLLTGQARADPDRAQPRQPPRGLPAPTHPRRPDWFGTDEDEDDLSPFQQQLARDLEHDLPHLAELCALAYDLWPPDEGLASAHIGGYADDEVITIIAEQTLAGREKAGETVIPAAKWYSHVENEKHRLANEWVPLARFSLADEFYYGSL
ncbi:hypothetical protein ACH4OY_10585 [Micromonospora rubida]|uniref:Uncharacterized protein n=1 Tax=Micromonospora rubida TaxID=2697657 RepID=A0ABW7SLM8_9ACTN